MVEKDKDLCNFFTRICKEGKIPDAMLAVGDLILIPSFLVLGLI
jgi:hypothetical protein